MRTNQNKHLRIRSLDTLRGVAMIFIIIFHASIYNFANIHKLDFSNPPIVIILMSFMALWGGIFIIYSTLINSFMISSRISKDRDLSIFKHLVIVGLGLMIAHFILNIFLGRWTVDFVNNQPNYTFIANFLRNGSYDIYIRSGFFEGSALSTIAVNLIFFSIFFFLLYKNSTNHKRGRIYVMLTILGTMIMGLSFLRAPLYPIYTQALEGQNYLTSIIYTFLFANPYPLITYLGYGFFGSLIGILIFDQRVDLLKKLVLPLGSLFVIIGIYGMSQFDRSISQPDYFWYFKTNFELGLFLIMITGVYLMFENKINFLNRLDLLTWFSRVGLTIYLSETFVSEIIRLIITPIIPAWDKTINSTLLFGILNVFVWIIILYFWNKINYKYSLEYYWVKLMLKFDKISTKLDP